MPITRLNFHRYFLCFEKFYLGCANWALYNCIPNAASSFKNSLSAIANKFYYNFNAYKNVCPVFKKSHFTSLKGLANDKSIYITRPDKGQGVVILNSEDYISKLTDILNDTSKFNKIRTDERKLIIQLEDRLNNQLRILKSNNTIPTEFYNEAYSSGSQLGSLYGLPKVHKNDCPMRPIVIARNTHKAKLSKLLVPTLSELASNEYTVTNSYNFVNSLHNINNANSYYMCSFDITSLYTNVPVAETIQIIIDKLFTNGAQLYKGFNKRQFKKVLELVLNDTYFKFNNSIFKQKEGLSMGSSISPLVANIFLNSFEISVLNSCPLDFKPSFYKRYLDDTFLLFQSAEQAQKFFAYINSCHDSIKFTFEGESNNSLPFLDVNITRSQNKFVTTVFRKATFTGLSTNFFSSIFYQYKHASITTLLFRAFRICSTYALFHEEVECLRNHFTNNLFPIKCFNEILRKFLDNQFKQPTLNFNVPRRTVYINLPFIGDQTSKLLEEIRQLMCRFYPQINPRFYFKNTNTIARFFNKYDNPDVLVRSSIIYKYTCNCSLQYIGSTQLQLFRRVSQHKGVSFRTGIPLSKPDQSAIRDHCNSHNHKFDENNFTIVDHCQYKTDLQILETLHIHTELPSLNGNQHATTLNMF